MEWVHILHTSDHILHAAYPSFNLRDELIFTCIDTEECISMCLQVSIDENESMSNQFCRMGLSPKI